MRTSVNSTIRPFKKAYTYGLALAHYRVRFERLSRDQNHNLLLPTWLILPASGTKALMVDRIALEACPHRERWHPRFRRLTLEGASDVYYLVVLTVLHNGPHYSLIQTGLGSCAKSSRAYSFTTGSFKLLKLL